MLIRQTKAWGGYYELAAFETVTLIEFSDPQTLAESCEYPGLKALLTPFPAGDHALAVVPTDKVVEMREILAGFGVQVGNVLPH